MGRRGSVLTLVIINVVITLVVAFVVITLVNSQNANQPANQIVITVPILVTATRDPNLTETIRIITATPLPGTPGVVDLPTGLLDDTGGTLPPAPTIDPDILNADSSLQQTATALPANCILHTVKEGDTPFGIAQEYGADGFELLAVNGLDENGTRDGVYLQIGDVLIVPLEGCSLAAQALQATAVATEEPTSAPTTVPTTTGIPPTLSVTPTLSPSPSRTPTATLPPTAINAQVEIVRLVSPGDINAEGVGVRNNGAVVDLTGWTLSNTTGYTYTFPQQRLFTGSELTVYTKVGTDTPTAKFWGRDTALWSSGSALTLSDSKGKVQSTYIVP